MGNMTPDHHSYTAQKEKMGEYQSHKNVLAAKIVGMSDDKSHICTDDGTNWTNIAGANKPDPEIGWYVLLYRDGYVSFSPAPQFEAGYSKVVA